MSESVPIDIVDHQSSGMLEIAWADGHTTGLPHRLLRMQCRCAACEQVRRSGTDAPHFDDALRIVRIEPVGEHALNLAFSDGHDRGIYPWVFLRQLGAHPHRPSSPCPTPVSNAC